MKQVLAFGASNSKKSINKQLAISAAEQLKLATFHVLDLNDFSLPMYGIDEETANGIPEKAQEFNALLQKTDGIILSLAEHNGSYAAVFKNLYDWLSRIDKNVWKDKPLLLMATSPGARGGLNVLTTAQSTFSRMGAKSLVVFSLPSFHQNFQDGMVIEETLQPEFLAAVAAFEEQL